MARVAEKLQLAPDIMTADRGQKDVFLLYLAILFTILTHSRKDMVGDPTIHASSSWNGDTFVQIRSKIFWTSVGKSGCREKRRKTLSTRVVVVAEEVRRQNS